MRLLAFDTETTGIRPGLDKIVQLAYILHNTSTGVNELEANLLCRPDGWTIPQEASNVHGITTEHALEHGINAESVLAMFKLALESADAVVGHNVTFDKNFVNSVATVNWPETFDTMTLNIDVCQVPLSERQLAAQQRHTLPDGTFSWQPDGGWPKFKSPNLTETYSHYFGETFDGAHDALADVRATLAVYLKMRETT